MNAEAARLDGMKRTYERATFKERNEDVLTFIVDREGRMATVRGRLLDRTRIRDDQDARVEAETLQLGSLWNITLLYPLKREGIPAILGMRKIRGRMPQ
jgi:hypothetical protein